jgi:hypothetical protein
VIHWNIVAGAIIVVMFFGILAILGIVSLVEYVSKRWINEKEKKATDNKR